ncbi:hypothetical protein B0H17DRAFT_1063918 [Mycena rosella]|uniref:Cell division cycle protein 123 n=1 Tax=Mycena rosella TaxID=1033263 RepID=A0AAD7DGC5_MYCRO|nr:hypothetical protein B0H17DRAFT_1063918 [Mycena rosella]
MALLESIRAARPLRKAGGILHDASAPSLVETLQITREYDARVLQANIERWGGALVGLTPRTLLVPLTQAHAVLLLRAYESLEHAAEVVGAAAAGYTASGRTSAALVPEEAALLEGLGPQIQRAIDALSTGEGGCFVKLSSRSPKDAAARSGVFDRHYVQAVHAERELDDERRLWILCEAEGAALRFADAAAVVRALVLSERVWQDMTLALRHPESWEQNIVLRKWEAVPVDMEFRTFVSGGRITGISQYAYQLCSPRLNDGAQLTLAIAAIRNVFDTLWPILVNQEFSACVLDFGVISPMDGEGKWGATLIEINPFEETTDGALFSWTRERDVIEGKMEGVEYPVVRITERKRTGALAMVPRGWKEVMARVEKQLSSTDSSNLSA